MKRFYGLLIFSGIFLPTILPVAAQNSATQIIRKILREKVRKNPFENSALKTEFDKTYPELAGEQRQMNATVTENIVSASAEIESEIHAAINLTDTNNMVCSANAVGTATGNDIPINHIYYTTDYGTSWTKSLFNPLPAIIGVTVLGGGDPVFAYDKNGRVYHVWINLYLQGFTSVHWDLLWAYSNDGGVTWQRGSTPDVISTTGPITALIDPS